MTAGCSITTPTGRASADAPNGFQGIDLISGYGAEALDRRKGILIEEDELGAHLGRAEPMRTRTFVSDGWRISLYDGIDHGEMFDLRAEPLERRNQWRSPEYADRRARLVEDMLREMIRLGDTAPLTHHIA